MEEKSKIEELNEAVEADKRNRETLMLEELKVLLEKHNCEIVAKPFINEQGVIQAQPLIIAKP